MCDYNPSIWSNELEDGRRKYVATVLRNGNGNPIHMKTLASVIGEAAHEPMPDKYKNDNKSFHGSKYRRLLTGDIDALNRDPRFRFCIISDNKGVRICNSADFEKLYKMERKEALKKLSKLSILARKAGRDGQITITNEEIQSVVKGENYA